MPVSLKILQKKFRSLKNVCLSAIFIPDSFVFQGERRIYSTEQVMFF